MKIVKFINQHRRDFNAIYKCEGCGHEQEESGYDDRNFHDNVVPTKKCKSCGKSRNDLGVVEYERPIQTKYPEGMKV